MLSSLQKRHHVTQLKKRQPASPKAVTKGKGKAALLSLYNELYSEIARLE